MANNPFFYQELAALAVGHPHADMPLAFKQCVVDAVVSGWHKVIGTNAHFGDENAANAALHMALRGILDAGGLGLFSSGYFEQPIRDACELTYDGGNLHKRPDIALRRRNAKDGYDAWFVECKIVDTSRRVSLYQTEGIRRFVDGEYAWAMPSALMVGYAGSGFTTAGKLGSTLPAVEATTEDVCCTRHARAFVYLGTGGAPGEIELTHLWLGGGAF